MDIKNTMEYVEGDPSAVASKFMGFHVNYLGDFAQEYQKEKMEIKTEKDLENFIEKWKPIWTLPSPFDLSPIDLEKKENEKFKQTKENEQSLIRGTYDRAQTLHCLKINRNRGNCGCAEDGPSCTGMHLALPTLFIHLVQLSRQFGATINTCFIQLMQAYIKDGHVKLE